MRARETYSSIIHVFLFFLFLLSAVYFFVAGCFVDFRYYCLRLFLQNPFYSFFAACFCLSMSVALLFLVSYKKHLRFLMAPHSVDIDRKVIYSYVEQFWKEEFPQYVQSFDLYILPDNTLEIAVQFSSTDEEIRKRFLEKSEYGLGKILSGFLDYHQKFYITMHLP